MTERMTADEYRAQKPAKKNNKFSAKRVFYDGRWFASEAEKRRYESLRLLEKGKRIANIECQPKFDLFGKNGTLICTYKADFKYLEVDGNGYAMGYVIEDVKSEITAKRYDYKLKIKLLKDNHPGIDFREVKG